MRTLRRVLLLLGVLPALLAVAFAVKVGVMLDHDRDGRGLFGDGDHAAAAAEFGANDRLNLLEPWVARFDEGAALHADGRPEEAIGRYEAALADVPVEEECTVRINLALAHETLGDAAAADEQGAATAAEHWQAGIDVLAEGGCPEESGRGEEQTADAAEVDRRLREKLQQQEQEERERNRDPQDQRDRQRDRQQEREERERQQREQRQQEREQRERERKERRLEERNDEGRETQQDYDDTTRDRDYSEYQW
ncbi:hypothetical protein [Nocardioides sp. TF02-7]|uniref:hypothetical protein n=1 Tax=Nocardioides sp. TF02-7 TaxID=2917724 RepID=UPI001F06CCB6|nr:hypothetical protein [Nocardioides sp. TF02-7]UMG93450.1 hypothetical protein MF408_04245 [Nocardioides sp. TF02-7]